MGSFYVVPSDAPDRVKDSYDECASKYHEIITTKDKLYSIHIIFPMIIRADTKEELQDVTDVIEDVMLRNLTVFEILELDGAVFGVIHANKPVTYE